MEVRTEVLRFRVHERDNVIEGVNQTVVEEIKSTASPRHHHLGDYLQHVTEQTCGDSGC